jgi:hypothetical protein
MNSGTVGLIEAGRLQAYDSQLVKLATALEWPVAEAHRLVEESSDAD